MKKRICMIICTVIVFSLMVFPVNAIPEEMSASLTGAEAKSGQTVEMMLSLSGFEKASAVYVEIAASEELVLDAAASSWQVRGILQDISQENTAIWGTAMPIDLNGNLLKLCFTVPQLAAGEQQRSFEVSCTVTVRKYDQTLGTVTATANVTVAKDRVCMTRVYGATRYDTAIEAAQMMKEILGIDAFDAIIMASGEDFADALAGSYLAAVKNAPILLYRGNAVASNYNYILENLSDSGIVYLLGGNNAIPQSVEQQLQNSSIRVVRLEGPTRYETNLAIINEVGVGANSEILVCTGNEFADSLSASATGLPILLVNSKTNRLTDLQIAFLKSVGQCKITIIGGTGAVSQSLEDQLSQYGTVERISGATRYHTSMAVSRRYFDQADTVVLACGQKFPDGLCGGPLAYLLKAPLLLTDAGKETVVSSCCANISSGYAMGGPAVLSDPVILTTIGLDESSVDMIKY